jgi:hypothetical protein
MPAKSRAQQQAMAIAEHEPGKLYSKNKGLLKMSHSQLHDFASTKRKGLPAKAHPDDAKSMNEYVSKRNKKANALKGY